MLYILPYVVAFGFIGLTLNEMRIRFYEVQIYHDGKLLVSTNMMLEHESEAQLVRERLVEQCRDQYGNIDLVSYIMIRTSFRYGLYQAAFEVLNFATRCYNAVVVRLFG